MATRRNSPLVIFNPHVTIRSERQAWEHIKSRAAAAQRRGATTEELRALFIECDTIADTMLAQLYEGVHKNPGGQKLGAHVQAILYVHAKDKRCYVHGFGDHDPSDEELESGMLDMGALKTNTGVEMFFNPAHTQLTIRHKDGKKLVGLFPD